MSWNALEADQAVLAGDGLHELAVLGVAALFSSRKDGLREHTRKLQYDVAVTVDGEGWEVIRVDRTE